MWNEHKQCMRCGRESYRQPAFGTFFPMYFYSCKAPICDFRGVVFCANCICDLHDVEYNKKKGVGDLRCPNCIIGVLSSLQGFD